MDEEYEFDTTPWGHDDVCMKHCYDSKAEARAAELTMKYPQKPYYCKECEKWHLYSTTKVKK